MESMTFKRWLELSYVYIQTDYVELYETSRVENIKFCIDSSFKKLTAGLQPMSSRSKRAFDDILCII